MSHSILVDAGGMSVHPQAQVLLDARKQQKFVPDDNNIAQFRAVADQSSRCDTSSIRTVQSNKGLQASCCCRSSINGQHIASVEDIKIPGGAGSIKARVYNPEPQASAPLPVLVYLHGGGWVMCSIETHDALCRDLAKQSNIIVVSVDYRLAPEHKFPAGLEDCYAALLWVSQNAKQLNADSNRLAIGGDSAGGNLTAATLLLAHERGSVPVAFQLLMYPSCDVRDTESRRLYLNGYGLDKEMKTYFLNSYTHDPVEDGKNPLVSPLMADDLSFMPPTYLMTAECDPLRDEGKMLADRLVKDGVSCTYKCYEGMIHGFCTYMYMMPMDTGVQAVTDCVAQLKKYLHGSK